MARGLFSQDLQLCLDPARQRGESECMFDGDGISLFGKECHSAGTVQPSFRIDWLVSAAALERLASGIRGTYSRPVFSFSMDTEFRFYRNIKWLARISIQAISCGSNVGGRLQMPTFLCLWYPVASNMQP